MDYTIEIYVEGDAASESAEFMLTGTSAYPVPAVGDYLHRGWIESEHQDELADRLRVTRVEHVYAADNYRLLIYSEQDDPRRSGPRYA